MNLPWRGAFGPLRADLAHEFGVAARARQFVEGRRGLGGQDHRQGVDRIALGELQRHVDAHFAERLERAPIEGLPLARRGLVGMVVRSFVRSSSNRASTTPMRVGSSAFADMIMPGVQ